MKNRAWCVLVVIALALMATWPDDQPPKKDDLQLQQEMYCEMVKTFKETNGRFGWPDYRGIFRKVCK